MIHKTFISGIAAIAIAITGLTTAPARASDDTAKIIAGVAALAIIGSAIAKSRNDDDHVVARHRSYSNHHHKGFSRHHKRSHSKSRHRSHSKKYKRKSHRRHNAYKNYRYSNEDKYYNNYQYRK